MWSKDMVIFRNGWSSWRRRAGRYFHPVWLLSISDGCYDRNDRYPGTSCADFARAGYVVIEKSG